MLPLSFEKDRETLENQYFPTPFFENSGLAPEQLLEECRVIERTGAPFAIRRARVIRTILEQARLYADDVDLFADHLQFEPMIIAGVLRPEEMAKAMEEEKELLEENRAAQEACCFTGDADFSHTSPDWEAILTLGLPGLRERAITRLRKAAGKPESDFYESTLIVLDGFFSYVRRLSAALKENGGERALFVANALDRLLKAPPETTHEALQLIYLFYNVQSNVECAYVRTFGVLDQLLEPYYRADLARGVTKDEIRELMRYFITKLDALRVPANQPFALGCIDENGSTCVTELSRLILEEFISLAPVYTKIHIRYSPALPDDFVQTVLDSIARGANSFVFINNAVAADALCALGEAREHCTDYGIVGCYEIYAQGRELPCTCNGRVSLPKALECALTGGRDLMTGAQLVPSTGEDYETFDELYASFEAQLSCFIDRCVALTDAYERHYPAYQCAPLLSSSYASCMEAGRDVYDGGAVYNSSSINVFGTATAADALSAIKTAVFDEKKLTLQELKEILKNDWKGNEALRLRFLRDYPKYGNNDPLPDLLARRMLSFCAERINGRKNTRGGTYRMGSFSIDWRTWFGEKTGASADGRRAGEPLSKNVCAGVARDRHGVTAHVNSAAGLLYEEMPNGTVLDLVLHASAVQGSEGRRAFRATLDTFMREGGFAVQYNVLSPDTLREAQKNPEKYQTLQVRLCGWNVRFVDLTKKEQDEFIAQCEV